MSRSFLLFNILNEAYAVDNDVSRRQALNIRRANVFNRQKDYVALYRLKEEMIDDLLQEINLFVLNLRPTRRRLSMRVKLLCTLSFLASGSYQKILGRDINTFLSQPSASRCIHEVINVLSSNDFVKKYIRFPQNTQERQVLKERFYEKFRIPGVIGCVDGTFVTMVRPKENEERYFCRKGNHARNVLLITDADLNILHVDATYGGATHDNFIFHNSVIRTHLEQLDETAYLLGDSGYAQRSYVMTPVLNAAEGSIEAHYNKLHASARNTVERAIGRLKGRFRCLLVHRVLHYDPDMVGKIVIACCVLHNLCNRAGLPAPDLDPQEEEREMSFQISNRTQERNPVVASQHEIAIGQSERQHLINTLWRARNM